LVVFNGGKQIQQADDVIVVNVTEHYQIKLSSLSDDFLERRFQIGSVVSGWAPVDQDMAGLGRSAERQNESVAVFSSNDVELEHGPSCH
jgi:hypothetical protein